MLKAAWERKNFDEIETPKEYKERIKRKRIEDWSGKQLHGQFKRETEDLSGVSWNWIRTGELKKETEGLIFAAQDQALRTNEICPGLTLIRCTRISISVTKCPLALLANFNITCVSEYIQLMSQSVPQMLLFK